KNALEPQWEVKFEATSYGFRPKRSTHDAISNLFNKLNTNSKKKWVFEGDFLGCFDHLNHKWIIEQTSAFSGNNLIRRWLEMGYMEQDMLHKTAEGTPQGSIVSPLLANIALCGMEEEIGIVYKKTYKPGSGYKIDPKCKIGRVL
ncbi:reverse transcriptase domain-containing protein, partial [Priestia megaterium]